MEALQTEYRKNSYKFKQVSREGDIAIYEQREPITNKIIAYEVFIVQNNPERVISGRTIQATESTPGNEQWGQQGFTTHTLQQAVAKIPYLSARIQARGSRAAK